MRIAPGSIVEVTKWIADSSGLRVFGTGKHLLVLACLDDSILKVSLGFPDEIRHRWLVLVDGSIVLTEHISSEWVAVRENGRMR